jgi:CrcB protein
MIGALLVGCGGALGAVCRHLVGNRVDGRAGTLTVNVVGSFLLGVVGALGLPAGVSLALGTGFCGAFTTFSTFAVETERAGGVRGLWYATGTLVLALGAVVLGEAVVG